MAEEAQVLLFPFPAQGHIIPSCLLAKKLAENGARVTIVTFDERLPRVNEALGASHEGIQVHSLGGESPPENWSKRGHDTENSVSFLAKQSHECMPNFEKLLEQTKALAGSLGTKCCIVSDTLIGWTQDSANKFGVERYIFYPSPAAILAGVFYVKTLMSEGLLPLNPKEDAFTEVPGLGTVRTTDMHSYLLEGVSEWGRNFYVSNCMRIHEASGVLVNTFEELEDDAVEAVRSNGVLNPSKVPVFSVGPLLPEYLFSPDYQPTLLGQEECKVWLDSRRPASVVYISFGSIKEISGEQVTELAAGLEASGVSFLWVLRDEQFLPPGFLSRTCDRGFIVSNWVPQQEILAHFSIAGFLTHCGWNSLMESFCLGVPMLTLPYFSDQAMNARLVERLRLGFGLRSPSSSELGLEMVSGKEVELTIKCFVENLDNLRKRAISLKEKAAKARKLHAPKELETFLRKVREH